MRARQVDELQYDYCCYRLNDKIITKAKLKGMAFVFKEGASAQRRVPKLIKGEAAKKRWKKAKRKMLNARAELVD